MKSFLQKHLIFFFQYSRIQISYIHDRTQFHKWWAHQVFSQILKLGFFFHEAEFVYLFLCSVNVNNNINFEEKIGKKVGENIWWAT